MSMNKAFSIRNIRRCESPEGFNHNLEEWSPSDWMVALFGELGEAANVLKKMNRVRDGIPGNKENLSQLKRKLANELADTYIYLDLFCHLLGIDLGRAVERVFNEKSQAIGYKEPKPCKETEMESEEEKDNI